MQTIDEETFREQLKEAYNAGYQAAKNEEATPTEIWNNCTLTRFAKGWSHEGGYFFPDIHDLKVLFERYKKAEEAAPSQEQIDRENQHRFSMMQFKEVCKGTNCNASKALPHHSTECEAEHESCHEAAPTQEPEVTGRSLGKAQREGREAARRLHGFAPTQESLKFKCWTCMDSGFLPKALIFPEPPDVRCPNGCRPPVSKYHELAMQVDPALKAAPSQEPVAWMGRDGEDFSYQQSDYFTIPLYTTLPESAK